MYGHPTKKLIWIVIIDIWKSRVRCNHLTKIFQNNLKKIIKSADSQDQGQIAIASDQFFKIWTILENVVLTRLSIHFPQYIEPQGSRRIVAISLDGAYKKWSTYSLKAICDTSLIYGHLTNSKYWMWYDTVRARDRWKTSNHMANVNENTDRYV